MKGCTWSTVIIGDELVDNIIISDDLHLKVIDLKNQKTYMKDQIGGTDDDIGFDVLDCIIVNLSLKRNLKHI